MKKSRELRSGLAIAGTAAAAACLLTYPRYRSDLDTARKRAASGSRIAQTRCGPVEYAVAGSGPPVLFVHGAGGGFDQGLEFGRPLVERGYRVIAVSRFGYLRTPMPRDASPEAQADAHACLLDALDLPRVAVLGGSAGAPSSMQFALRHPERCSALVLVVPAAFAPGASIGTRSAAGERAIGAMLRSDFTFWAIMKLAPRSMIRTLLATPVGDFDSAPPEEQERALRAMRLILPVSRRAHGLENDARICGALPRYELEKISAPTLVVTTENDGFRTLPGARYSAEHIGRARFVSYPTGGHMWLGHDEEISDLIAGFLSEGGRGISEDPAPRRAGSNEPLGSSAELIQSAHALAAGR
jgi:pimeloyl-ACP methyl ester carboxylesterase